MRSPSEHAGTWEDAYDWALGKEVKALDHGPGDQEIDALRLRRDHRPFRVLRCHAAAHRSERSAFQDGFCKKLQDKNAKMTDPTPRSASFFIRS